MPYIKATERSALTPLSGREPRNAGELNYQLTCLVRRYWATHRGQGYQALNDIVGALDGAKAEFQRRVIAPYEDQKIEENGDVE